MNDNREEYGCEQCKKEKSILDWWARLTDYCWELFKYNLLYLIFVLPPFVCMHVFLFFNAHLFLLAGALLFIPAGPAMLTIYKAASKITSGELRIEHPNFFSSYKKYLRHGFAFSFILVIIVSIMLYPVYFVLVTNSVMKIAVMICAGITMLLLCSVLPYIACIILSDGRKGILKKALAQALIGGKASFFSGLLQATWLFCCIAYPYVAVFAALLGMPAVIRMTALYILPNMHEKKHEA